jgi:hypothetical protein
MAYIKGVLVGVFTFFVATIAYLIIAIRVYMRRLAPHAGVEIGFDLRILVNSPLYWLIAIAAFALGFYLELRITT